MDSIFSWQTLWYLILVLYVPACIGLILVVLLQKGKGVGFAGAFGMGGGSDTIFGPRATKSLPQRLTYVMAGVFMVLALVMSLIAGRIGGGVAPEPVAEPTEDYSVLEDLGTAVEGAEPAAPGVTTETPVPVETPAPVEAPAPADEAPGGEAPAVVPPEPAAGSVLEQPTGEAGQPIAPSVEPPEPLQSSPAQGTPPAVPVPPAPPSSAVPVGE